MVIMPRIKTIKTQGRLILSEINFSECFETVVKPGGSNSGRIYLPNSWIGKKVYVVIKGE